MKRFANILTAAVLWTAAVFGLNSCIFEASGDKFYRTLWEADEEPLGPFRVEELTLEFLCGSSIAISTDARADASFGTYSCNDQTAVFQDLTIELDGMLITFVDAQRSGDILYLRWCTEASPDPFTTVMHRLSEYKSKSSKFQI
jgi:hypothetical protein